MDRGDDAEGAAGWWSARASPARSLASVPALDAAVAGDLERRSRRGPVVLSNAKNFRMEPDVPLVIRS